MNHLISFVFCCCINTMAAAQSEHPDSAGQKKQQWIEHMSEYIQLRLTQSTDTEKFAVMTTGNSGTSQFISPNAASATSIGLSYKFLSFSYSFIPKNLPGNDDDDIKGKTKGSGYNLNFNFSKWQQVMAYGKTTGYYLENTKDFDFTWQEGDPYAQLPNLRYTNYEGITAYKFNSNYSLNAVASQSERQLRSAGSFMPSLLYRYYILDDRTPITSTNTTFKSNNFEMLLGAGYYHTFVMKKSFYAALGVTPAAGFIRTNFFARTATQTTETSATNFIFRWDLRGGIGYNGERFFAGGFLRGFGAANKQSKGSTAINTDARLAIQLFLGYRLRAPKWLKINVEKVRYLSTL